MDARRHGMRADRTSTAAYSGRPKAGSVFERTGQFDEYVVVAPDRKTSIEVVTPTRAPGHRGLFADDCSAGKVLSAFPPVVNCCGFFRRNCLTLLRNVRTADSFCAGIPIFRPTRPGLRRGVAFGCDLTRSMCRPRRGGLERIFICTTLMINYANPRHGRSNGMLSPHSHDDFEQGTLVLGGTFTHHLRWPWTRKRAAWRDDEHDFCHAPSMSVAPARVIHTAEAMGEGANQLLDVWAPPRH